VDTEAVLKCVEVGAMVKATLWSVDSAMACVDVVDVPVVVGKKTEPAFIFFFGDSSACQWREKSVAQDMVSDPTKPLPLAQAVAQALVVIN